MAPRPLPRLRRGRRVLGARGDGPYACGDNRGRGAGIGDVEASRIGGRVRDGRRGASLRRAAAPPPLGLEDGAARGKEELFGAWRLFFERMAEQGPVVTPVRGPAMGGRRARRVHRATCSSGRGTSRSSSSASRARSSRQHHPEFGQGSHQTTLSLAPLSEQSMRELLDGFVPGLPDDLRERILARSEGVPLYAVETVRMLVDRGLLVEQDGAYRLTGEVAELEVPETLQGLIAARLDGLAAEERRLLQDASVLGKTFTKEALAELSQASTEAQLDPLLVGPRAQGGARRPGRPALAGARPVRVPAGSRAAGGIRDARPPRPQDTASRGCEAARSRASAPQSRRSSRSSRPTTSRRTRPRSMRRRCGGDQGKRTASSSPGPPSGRPRWAR